MIRPSEQPEKHLEYVPGQVVIKFEQSALPFHGGLLPALTPDAARFIPASVLEPLSYLRTNAGLGSVLPLFSERTAEVEQASPRRSVRDRLAVLASITDEDDDELAGINVLSLDPQRVTSSLLRHVNSSNVVEFVEKVPARWLAAAPRRTADAQQNLQWGLRAISWFQADRPSTRGVRVAVLDTGIDQTHPDFNGVHIEYHHSRLSKQDILGHGTHVAGTISAQVNNQMGIAGVANCGLAVWKIFGDTPAYDGKFYVDPTRYYRALREVALFWRRRAESEPGRHGHRSNRRITHQRDPASRHCGGRCDG